MKDLLDRRRFRNQHQKWDDALREQSTGDLPPLRREYRDGAGSTSLVLDTFSPYMLGERACMSFDISYAHDADGGSVAERRLVDGISELPEGLRFADFGEFGADLALHRPTVGVPVAQLSRRQNLFPLGHEIGHFLRAKLGDAAIELATGHAIDRTTQSALEPYAPAVGALAAYAAAHPNLAEDYAKIKNNHQAHPDLAAIWAHCEPGARLPMIVGAHEPVYELANVIAEVSAWTAALGLVEQGALHPGMTAESMHTVARASLATYDKCVDNKLHASTFDYALANLGPNAAMNG